MKAESIVMQKNFHTVGVLFIQHEKFITQKFDMPSISKQ